MLNYIQDLCIVHNNMKHLVTTQYSRPILHKTDWIQKITTINEHTNFGELFKQKQNSSVLSTWVEETELPEWIRWRKKKKKKKRNWNRDEKQSIRRGNSSEIWEMEQMDRFRFFVTQLIHVMYITGTGKLSIEDTCYVHFQWNNAHAHIL